jgi:hypothetical protein
MPKPGPEDGAGAPVRPLEQALLSLPSMQGSQIVWDLHGSTHRVRVLSNGVSAYSGWGASRLEALVDLMWALRLEGTFDHPENPHARWGEICYVREARVWLVAIGWGYIWELQGVRRGRR